MPAMKRTHSGSSFDATRISTWVAAGLIGMGGLAPASGETAGERPDVVFVLVDDLRHDAFSFRGHPFVETPHMDALRERGAWMENAFVTTSICCPSRATFLTGTYASRHGVIDNQGAEYVPEITPSFTEQLRAGGYRAAMIGKWHMGHGDQPRPGFDYWLSFEGQGVYLNPVFNINGEKVQREGYTTDLLNSYALDFIRNQPFEEPYFLMLSHKAVHEPFEPAERHRGLWGTDREVAEPPSYRDTFEGKAEWQRRNQVKDISWERRDRDLEGMEIPAAIPEEDFARSRWYVDQLRCLASVDDGVGKIMAALEERGTLNRTVIVIAGDNGYFHGEHRRWDKRVPYEEGMRIPMIIFYPGKIADGTTITELVTNLDFAPTILEYAGLEKTPLMQGQSMTPLLSGEPVKWREAVFYEYFVDLVHSIPATLAVRTDRYKFIRYPALDDLDELYDLQKDPHEMVNRIGHRRYAEVRREMEETLERMIQESGWRPDVRPHNIADYRGPRGRFIDLRVSGDAVVNQASADVSPSGKVKTMGDFMIFDGKVNLDCAPGVMTNAGQGPAIIETWIKAEADGVIASQSNPEAGWKLFIQDGKPGVTVFRKTWIGSHSTLDGKERIMGRWAHLRVILDWNRFRLEVDGELAAEMALPMAYETESPSSLIVGASAEPDVFVETPTNRFVGKMRQFVFAREKVE